MTTCWTATHLLVPVCLSTCLLHFVLLLLKLLLRQGCLQDRQLAPQPS